MARTPSHPSRRHALTEQLEPRRLLAFSASIDFTTAAAATVSGYLKDTGATYADRGNGYAYGWNVSNTSAARDRNAHSDARYDTLTHTQLYGSRTWEIAVPNGTYSVRLVAGDPSYFDSNYRFNAEGNLILSGVPTSSSRFVDRTATVTVTDGRLTISNASGASNNKLAFAQITETSSSPAGTTSQSPYGGAPIALAGRIQAENFDNGGQGVSWSDTDSANKGGAYRSTAVDLYSYSGGTAVGATRAGEWLEYTVNVASAGTYDFAFRVASGGAGGAFHLQVDGSNKTGTIQLNNTGGWHNYTTLTKTGISLTAGTHVLRLQFDKANVANTDIGNVDWIDVVKQGSTTPNPGAATWPSTWQQVASSPIPRFEAYGFSYNNQLYTFGGFNNDTFKGVTRMDRYNPATNTWTYIGEMKAPETHAGVAVDYNTGYAYFVTGYRGPYPATPTSEVWRYDIKNNSWLRLPDFPFVGGAGDAAVVNGKLHYFGGSLPDRVTNTGRHYALDLSNTSAGWKQMATQPLSRDHQSVVVWNNEIYVVGGEYGHDHDMNHQKIFQKYNPATNTWTRLADAPIAKSHAESSVTIVNGQMIWAGGQTFPGQSGTSNVVAYNFATGAWSTLKSLPAARQGATVKLVGDVIVVANGGVTTWQPQSTVWIGKL